MSTSHALEPESSTGPDIDLDDIDHDVIEAHLATGSSLTAVHEQLIDAFVR